MSRVQRRRTSHVRVGREGSLHGGGRTTQLLQGHLCVLGVGHNRHAEVQRAQPNRHVVDRDAVRKRRDVCRSPAMPVKLLRQEG